MTRLQFHLEDGTTPDEIVSRWLNEDEGLRLRTVEALKGAAEFHVGLHDARPYRVYVAEWLRAYVEEDLLAAGLATMQESDNPAGLVDHLAQWTLRRVDWLTLADAWMPYAVEGES